MKYLPTASSEPLADLPLPPADQHAGAIAALGRLRSEARRQIAKLSRLAPCPQVSTDRDEPVDRHDVLPSTDKHTRRNVMGMMGSAAATSVGATLLATQPVAAFATRESSSAEVDKLYEERTQIAARSRTLNEQWKAAEDSMPWWARPGHKYVRSDGTWGGESVGWPAIDDGKLSSHPNQWINKRVTPHEIRKDRVIDAKRASMRPEEAHARYRRRMRDLITRLRRQREEEVKAGLQQLQDQLDAIGERLSEIDEKIENLSVTAAGAPQKAAAVILITSLYDHWRKTDCFGNSATLVALQPFLTGQIREHVDYVVEHADAEMCAMPFYSAA